MMGVLKPTYVSVTLVISTVSIPSSYTLPSLWPLSTPHIAGLHGFGGEASAGGGGAAVAEWSNLFRLGFLAGAGLLFSSERVPGPGPVAEETGAVPAVTSRTQNF